MCLCRGCPGSSTFRRRRAVPPPPQNIPMTPFQQPQDTLPRWQVGTHYIPEFELEDLGEDDIALGSYSDSNPITDQYKKKVSKK